MTSADLGHVGDYLCQNCEHKPVCIMYKSNAEFLTQINRQKVCNIYKKGQIIFNEASYPFGVFCIRNGKIKLARLGDDGKEQITRLLKVGDVVGHRALLSGDKYTDTAIALEDTCVCFIPKKLFINILKNDTGFTFEMLKLISDGLQKTELKLIHLAQKPIRERLAEVLLSLKETYGFENDGITINVQLLREEIADLTGTATESTIRSLSEFKRDGIIELDGKRIKIINEIKLRKTANLQGSD